MKESSKEKIVKKLQQGWRLFGYSNHMKGPRGDIIQVHAGTLKSLLRAGTIILKDKLSFEYILSLKKENP